MGGALRAAQEMAMTMASKSRSDIIVRGMEKPSLTITMQIQSRRVRV